MIRVFIDESGSPDRYIEGHHEPHDKYFTLAAVVIQQANYTSFKENLVGLRSKYDKYLLGKELKSNYIRYSNPRAVKPTDDPAYHFCKHADGQQHYEAFNAELKSLLQGTDFTVLSVTTDKERADKRYPQMPMYQTLLSNLWERISIYHLVNARPRMRIVFDRTNSDNDLILKGSYQFFKESGTWYFGEERLNRLELGKDVYSAVSDDSVGLQLADMMAHPIKKKMETGVSPFFDAVVRAKLHSSVLDSKSGKMVAMGRKRSLN
jgi:hypothetical protein